LSREATADRAVFGPVPSRRLGLSLGVDLVRPKTCSLDCVYCELGPTTRRTTRRARWRDAGEVLAQVEARLAELERPPQAVTLAGSGEPTLHQDLGRVLAELKRLAPESRLVVLTNGTLCTQAAVRTELAGADLVIPSLDAATPEAFRRVNRPAPGLEIEAVVAGLAALARKMPGRVWLEVLLVAGLNDSPAEVAAIQQAAELIAPELVQLGTVVRPPAVAGVRPVAPGRLAAAAEGFSAPCRIIAPPRAAAGRDRGRHEDQTVEMTRRRPLTLEDLAAAMGLEPDAARELVSRLLDQGRLRREPYGDTVFYRGV
jgi:wyosine [tRNA(Phe)-imidazoG37] synthetase (radical SAM superfamily)